MNINHVTIFGTGMMGSQIALHLLNSGLEVDWVKVTAAEDNLELTKDQTKFFSKKLFREESLNNLRYLSLNDWLKSETTTNLAIEAIIEDYEAKDNLYTTVEPHLPVHTILATNTSSLSIEILSANLNEETKQRFIGMHFFTPVRQSQLVELIPHSQFNQAQIVDLHQLIVNRMGKNYITAKDVTGFTANRIGFYSNWDIMTRAENEGLSVSETDAISGELIGRTKMGPYRLSDYTNIALSETATKQYRADKQAKNYFKPRTKHTFLIDNNWIGDSTEQGYYKKIDGDRYSINFDTQEYEKVQPLKLPQFKKKNLAYNLNYIFESDDDHSIFMWESLRNVMYFAAQNIGFATENYQDIDRAMVWGYNWQKGPFQMWDMMGFDRVKKRIKAELGDLPQWLENRTKDFYSSDSIQLVGENTHKLLAQTPGLSSIYTSKDQILVYVIETKNNVINVDLLNDIKETVAVLESNAYIGMVITTEGKNFSVGYDINAMTDATDEGNIVESLQHSLDLGHQVVSAVKFAQKPIVSAIRGYTLGGGAEIALQSYDIIAATETQFGLVESQIGLIPGGGGLSELADRIYRSNLSRYEKKLQMQKIFNTVGFGKRSNNAHAAVDDGYLKKSTTIVHHADLILEVALDRVRQLNKSGFVPVRKTSYEVFGSDFIASMVGQINNYKAGDFINDYQAKVLKAVAYVLAGGDIPMGSIVTQDQMFHIETEKYIELATSEESYQMMSEKVK